MVKLFAIATVVALAWWVLEAQRRRRQNLPDPQTSIAKAASVIREQDTVIASAVSAFAVVHALYADALTKLKDANPGIDTTDLDAAVAEAQAATPALASAIAVNTDASDEVHTDDGGTGTAPAGDGGDGTVVDPATVDTTAAAAAVTEPTADGEQQEA